MSVMRVVVMDPCARDLFDASRRTRLPAGRVHPVTQGRPWDVAGIHRARSVCRPCLLG
jgi:hypothetical protein